MTPEEREEWPCLQHGQCKHFRVNADLAGVQSTCKRLDHKNIKFAVPWFKSYDCGQLSSNICEDFEPRDTCKWLKEHWDGIERYFGENYTPGGYVGLILNNDTSIRYYVKAEDFYRGSFLNDVGSLKWEYREYYRRSRSSPIGYRLEREKYEDCKT